MVEGIDMPNNIEDNDEVSPEMIEATNDNDERQNEEAGDMQHEDNDRNEGQMRVRRGARDRKQKRLFTYDELGRPKVNNVHGNITHLPTNGNHHLNQSLNIQPVMNVIQPYEQCFPPTSHFFEPVMYAYPSHPQQIVYYGYEPQYQAQYQTQYY